jgi:hypothetical protein
MIKGKKTCGGLEAGSAVGCSVASIFPNISMVIVFLISKNQLGKRFIDDLKLDGSSPKGILLMSLTNVGALKSLTSNVSEMFSLSLDDQLEPMIYTFAFLSSVIEDIPQITILSFAKFRINAWSNISMLVLIGSVIALLLGLLD